MEISPEAPVDDSSRLDLGRLNEELAALVSVTDGANSTWTCASSSTSSSSD